MIKSKFKLKVSSLALAAVLALGSIVLPVNAGTTAKAAKKAYCAGLKLNNDIKINKTQTFKKEAFYYEDVFFSKAVHAKANYTITSKRKSAGKNYKVTYKVKYKYFSNPKLQHTEIWYDDWYWAFISPSELYTVFDYNTGMSLEAKNKLGVKVSGGKFNYTYYPKQYYKYTDEYKDKYDPKDCWIRNAKTLNYSFTVTYPKKCKDVVVGIGFVNRAEIPDVSGYKKEPDNQYWTGKKTPYGKTSYYKEGKKTMSYMRLK